jgi:hypothetical protein
MTKNYFRESNYELSQTIYLIINSKYVFDHLIKSLELIFFSFYSCKTYCPNYYNASNVFNDIFFYDLQE